MKKIQDQLSLGPGDATEERGHGEQGQAADEEPAPAEEVGEAASEEKRAAEEDRVGRDDPLKACLGEPEVRLDRGERHVDDRHVEDDHELRGDYERQRTPAPTRIRCGQCQLTSIIV